MREIATSLCGARPCVAGKKLRWARLLCGVAVAALMTGCPPITEEGKKAHAETYGSVMENPQQSPAFTAFIGKLRRAVNLRDYPMMASMMTANFGFDLNSNLEGPAPAIQYWNQNGLWPELERILAMEFSKYDRYLVSPPAFAMQTEKKPYTGFRAGIEETRSGFKFAYFVSDQSYGAATYNTTPAGLPDPRTYEGDTPPTDTYSDLPLPQSQQTPEGPRVLANPTSPEYMGAPVPLPRDAGLIKPIR